MPFQIRLSEEAREDLQRLRKVDSARIIRDLQRMLSVTPTVESKAVVKRLRQPAPTQYRLRVGDFRVFYNVGPNQVAVVRILSKEQAAAYLEPEQDASSEGPAG